MLYFCKMKEKLYYYSDGKTTFGPVTISELEHINIRKNTLVWCEGMKDWQYAKERADLLCLFDKKRISYNNNADGLNNFHVLKENDHKKQKALFIVSTVFGFMLMFGIYAVMFNSLSETELINISMVWIVPFVFGFSGLISIAFYSRAPVRVAIVTTVLVVVFLILLFNVFWGAL